MAEAGDAARAHAAHAAAMGAATAPLVRMGNDLLRAVALINGIAAIATLVVILTVLRDARAFAFWLVFPLGLFGFGATVSAFATGFAYLAQSREAAGLGLRQVTEAPPYLADTDASRGEFREAERFRRFGMVAVLVAMASAILGFLLSGAVLLIHLR